MSEEVKTQYEIYREQGLCCACGGKRDTEALKCKKCRTKQAVRDRLRLKKEAEKKNNELSEAGKALDENRVRWWESFEGKK